MIKKAGILIVDDHAIVRKGVQIFLESNDIFKVVGEAASGEEAIKMAEKLKPDIILMDIRMPGMNGIEACRLILEKDPHANVVMLTSYSDEESVMASILAGAKGYILKKVDTEILLEDLEKVFKGESLLDPAVTQLVFEKLRDLNRASTCDNTAEELNQLTNQERRILELIARGKTNKEIAAELFLSAKTVRNYVTNILAQVGLLKPDTGSYLCSEYRLNQRQRMKNYP